LAEVAPSCAFLFSTPNPAPVSINTAEIQLAVDHEEVRTFAARDAAKLILPAANAGGREARYRHNNVQRRTRQLMNRSHAMIQDDDARR
jgi:hypothetical protein